MFSKQFALLAFAFVGCAAPVAERAGEGETDSDGAAIATVKTGYVTVRRDFRKCSFPMCSGYYVKAAETSAKLRCADGSSSLECYVPELQLSALKLSAAQKETLQSGVAQAILYGQTAPKTYNGAAWGTFVVQKAWLAPNAGATKGALYFVSDNPTASGRKYQGVRLNYSARRTFDLIDFGAAPGTDAQWDSATAAAGTDPGVILGGAITGTTSKLFEADQFFFRFPGKATASCTEALGAKVTAVSDGMTWPSESDYPIDFVSAAGAPSLEAARALAGASTTTSVEERGFDEWFNHVVTAWDDDPISIANAERFRTLKSTLSANLTDLKVYRFGSINIRVVITGRTSCGTTAGIATTVIET